MFGSVAVQQTSGVFFGRTENIRTAEVCFIKNQVIKDT
jgi:hypothetical protein